MTGFALTLLVLLAGDARAEPHFSSRTGLRCARCHTSPLGGGKRTPYGALYALSSLALASARPPLESPGTASEGPTLAAALSVGEVTEWLALGADLRVASTTTLGKAVQNSFETTQATLYLELRPWPDRVVLYLDEAVGAGGAINREAWALIHGPWSTTLRGGRILPPFGLRLVDDGAYTRRATGADFSRPDLGLELGVELGPVFAALSLTNGTFAGSDTDTMKALSGLVELTWDPLRVGLSGAYNPGETGCRAMGGLFAGLRLGRLVLQAEADLISDRPVESPRRGYGLAALAEVDLLITKGLDLRVAWDFHDADLQRRGDRRQQLRLGIDLFPLRLVEVKLFYVIRHAETGKPEDEADLLEVMLHAFL